MKYLIKFLSFLKSFFRPKTYKEVLEELIKNMDESSYNNIRNILGHKLEVEYYEL